MEYILFTALIMIIILMTGIKALQKKLEEELDENLKTLDELNQTLMELKQVKIQEIYLLKTMNDSMNVIDPKGFMVQRMQNAPSDFKPKEEDEIKPDKIN